MTPKQLYATYRGMATDFPRERHLYRLLYLIARFKDEPDVLKVLLQRAYSLASERKLSHGHQPGVEAQFKTLQYWLYLAGETPPMPDPGEPEYAVRSKLKRRANILHYNELMLHFFDTIEDAKLAFKAVTLPLRR